MGGDGTMDFDDILKRYQSFRTEIAALANRLIPLLTRKQIEEGARRLGLMNNRGILVFNSEAEFNALMDFCAFGLLDHGKNLIDRALALKDMFDEQERRILKAMSESHYTVLIATGFEPGYGMFCLDAVEQNETPIFLADVLLSQTMPTDAVMASRIVPVDEFYVTSGAGIPIYGRDPLNRTREIILSHQERHPEIIHGIVKREADAAFAERMIRMLLSQGLGSAVAYVGPDEHPQEVIADVESSRMHARPGLPSSYREPAHRHKIGPNEPCPCGSGKKYKKCCGGHHH